MLTFLYKITLLITLYFITPLNEILNACDTYLNTNTYAVTTSFA